jgi:hypothetical protein
MAQHRCTECRKWFAPAATASKHQRVCGKECRRHRRNKLARRRRCGGLGEQRAEERERQRKHRDGAKRGGCHEPASDGKRSELLIKLQQIVDKSTGLSRATFQREARQILRKCGAFVGSELDGAGPCHELPSARKVAETESLSVVFVDGVTSQHGL